MGTAESLPEVAALSSTEGLACCSCVLMYPIPKATVRGGALETRTQAQRQNDSGKVGSLEKAEQDLGIVALEPVISTLIWQR